MTKITNYLSLVKFSHTIFALPFAMIGFFLAIKVMDPIPPKVILEKFLLVLGCMVTARSAAMAFNRYLDRKFDALNPRTSIREIPAGIISARQALIFTVVCCILFMTFAFAINKLCFYLSPVALFVILFYSYTKRFTSLCHLVLGLGLSLAPIGAYLAITESFSLVPLMFSFAVIFWVSGFDIIYALQDSEFDKQNDLRSIPAWLGNKKALRLSAVLHFLSFICVSIAGKLIEGGWLYTLGTAIFAGMLMYQHSLVKPYDLRKVNIAFMTANGIASVVFAIFVIADLYIKF